MKIFVEEFKISNHNIIIVGISEGTENTREEDCHECFVISLTPFIYCVFLFKL